jgi:hypothetical protein
VHEYIGGQTLHLELMGVDSFTSVDLGERDIYIHKCDLSSVGDDRGGGCLVMTYWPVDG